MKKEIQRIVDDFQSRTPIRAKSLIITLFGDVVSQHGKVIWLGSIAAALEDLGINDRLVRTSVFRLVKEDWLGVDKLGRKSFYRFTDYGALEYQRAARRIYSSDNGNWRGGWQLVLPTQLPERKRDDFRRSLQWLGFRALTNGTFARPSIDDSALKDLLDEFDLEDSVIVMEAKTSPLTQKKHLRQHVSEQWDLDTVGDSYSQLIKLFRPLRRSLDKGMKPAPQEAFIARLLMIHDYRRTLLRDTPLPDDLLSSGWAGNQCRELVAGLYHDLATPSQLHHRNPAVTKWVSWRTDWLIPRALQHTFRRLITADPIGNDHLILIFISVIGEFQAGENLRVLTRNIDGLCQITA
nr:PaaX family transcriptional regulator C-terminal domain-containing protein [Luminiphilus syltensis]